jgi:hypothetical protein
MILCNKFYIDHALIWGKLSFVKLIIFYFIPFFVMIKVTPLFFVSSCKFLYSSHLLLVSKAITGVFGTFLLVKLLYDSMKAISQYLIIL